jgi:hypothetical protein
MNILPTEFRVLGGPEWFRVSALGKLTTRERISMQNISTPTKLFLLSSTSDITNYDAEGKV